MVEPWGLLLQWGSRDAEGVPMGQTAHRSACKATRKIMSSSWRVWELAPSFRGTHAEGIPGVASSWAELSTHADPGC